MPHQLPTIANHRMFFRTYRAQPAILTYIASPEQYGVPDLAPPPYRNAAEQKRVLHPPFNTASLRNQRSADLGISAVCGRPGRSAACTNRPFRIGQQGAPVPRIPQKTQVTSVLFPEIRYRRIPATVSVH